MGAFLGSNKIKFFYGSHKCKKGFLNGEKIWSGASVVTYQIDTGITHTEEIDEGESVLGYTPVKSGWTFLGWRDDSTASDSVHTSKVATGEPMTLYAVFYQNVTVNWYNNSSVVSAETKKYLYNNSNTVAPTFKRAVASVSGWSVRGWSTSNTGNANITYNSNVSFTRTSNISLYGLYSKTVTVTYSGNGNTSGSTSASTGTAYRNASGTIINASISLRSNGFAKSGWTFKGWGTSASASTVISTYTGYTNTTIYAIWKQVHTLASTGVQAYQFTFTQYGTTGEDVHDYSNPLRWYFGAEKGGGDYPRALYSYSSFDRKNCDTLSLYVYSDYHGSDSYFKFGTATAPLPAPGTYGYVNINIAGQPQSATLSVYLGNDANGHDVNVAVFTESSYFK